MICNNDGDGDGIVSVTDGGGDCGVDRRTSSGVNDSDGVDNSDAQNKSVANGDEIFFYQCCHRW